MSKFYIRTSGDFNILQPQLGWSYQWYCSTLDGATMVDLDPWQTCDWLVVEPPLWKKYISQLGLWNSHNIWKNKQCSKPPTRWCRAIRPFDVHYQPIRNGCKFQQRKVFRFTLKMGSDWGSLLTWPINCLENFSPPIDSGWILNLLN